MVVAGPSGGGALSLWALAERPEVTEAVAVSPFLHPKTGLPVWAMKPMARYLTFGRWLSARPDAAEPPHGSLTLVVNEHDPSIDAPYNVALTGRLVPAARLRIVTIPDSTGLGHDLFDPQGENRDKIAEAYGYLADAFRMKMPDPTNAP